MTTITIFPVFLSIITISLCDISLVQISLDVTHDGKIKSECAQANSELQEKKM